MAKLRVIPAYGRDYKSLAAAQADWAAGKDFQIRDHSHKDDGRYVNIKDFPKGEVVVRYDKLCKQAVLQKG